MNFFSSIAQSVLFRFCPRSFIKKPLHYIGRWSGSPFLFRGTYGLFYLLRARNAVDNHIARDGIHEGDGIAAVIEQVRKSRADLFVDIGSNLGSYALAVAKETDCKQIFAFEPDPFNRAHLCANIFLNELEDRIRVFDEAVSDTKGEAVFYAARKTPRTHKENTGASSLEPLDLDPERTHEVRVQTDRLDNLLGGITGRTIVVKMDIERHESRALEGMRNFINNNRVWLQIEIVSTYAEQSRAVLRTLNLIEQPQAVPGTLDFIFTSP